MRVRIVGDGPHFGQIAEICKGLGLAWEHQAAPKGPDTAGVLSVGAFLDGSGRYQFCPPDGHPVYGAGGIAWKHPLCLVNLNNPGNANAVFLCGYPGSGNGIVGAIVEHIFSRTTVPPRVEEKEWMRYLRAFAADYLGKITDFSQSIASEIKSSGVNFATFHDDFGSVSFMEGEQYATAVLFNIRLYSYIYENIHKTHEPFSKTTKSHVRNDGRVLLAVRNPLDVLVSIGQKLWSGGVDILNNDASLRSIAKAQKRYYDSYIEGIRSGQVTPVRYEKLFSDWDGCIDLIARTLDVDSNILNDVEMRERLLGKPVSNVGHMWKPGGGKFKRYLAKRHYGLLDDCGYGDLLRSLDYEFCADDFELQPSEYYSGECLANEFSTLVFWAYLGCSEYELRALVREPFQEIDGIVLSSTVQNNFEVITRRLRSNQGKQLLDSVKL